MTTAQPPALSVVPVLAAQESGWPPSTATTPADADDDRLVDRLLGPGRYRAGDCQRDATP